MAYTSKIQVLTANRLGDGRVVYLGDSGWTSDLGAARLVLNEADAETAEAAGVMRKSLSHVKVLVHRARQRLLESSVGGPAKEHEVRHAMP